MPGTALEPVERLRMERRPSDKAHPWGTLTRQMDPEVVFGQVFFGGLRWDNLGDVLHTMCGSPRWGLPPTGSPGSGGVVAPHTRRAPSLKASDQGPVSQPTTNAERLGTRTAAPGPPSSPAIAPPPARRGARTSRHPKVLPANSGQIDFRYGLECFLSRNLVTNVFSSGYLGPYF